MTETEKVMNELNQWANLKYEKRMKQEIEAIIHNIANNLIEESKENGRELSYEEASKKAKELIS